jgi:four helix bundle protein
MKSFKAFPSDERYNMTHQVRRAALSVLLNIAEGASRNSGIERKRFFEIARGSLIEIDAAFDIACELGYLNGTNCEVINELMNKTFSMLTNLIKAKPR